MSVIPARLRRTVIRRAGNRCEYCRLAQDGQEATFHIDHIVPITAGGPTKADNLALACVSCSLYKAARQSAVDPETGREFPLYNPREQLWYDHFRWDGIRVAGISETRRATIAALRMNRPLILAIRQEETVRNRHPPL